MANPWPRKRYSILFFKSKLLGGNVKRKILMLVCKIILRMHFINSIPKCRDLRLPNILNFIIWSKPFNKLSKTRVSTASSFSRYLIKLPILLVVSTSWMLWIEGKNCTLGFQTKPKLSMFQNYKWKFIETNDLVKVLTFFVIFGLNITS